MPAYRAFSVTSNNLCTSSETSPIGTVAAVSPTKPLRITPISSLTRSPYWIRRWLPIPWTTSSLSDIQILPGNFLYPRKALRQPASAINRAAARSTSLVVIPGQSIVDISSRIWLARRQAARICSTSCRVFIGIMLLSASQCPRRQPQLRAPRQSRQEGFHNTCILGPSFPNTLPTFAPKLHCYRPISSLTVRRNLGKDHEGIGRVCPY